MKKYLILSVIILFAIACSTQKRAINDKSIDGKAIEEDSLEYDMETFDARFESWYLLQNGPAKSRSLEYYENWNKQYVSVWNNKSRNTQNEFFESIVGYDPNQEYGFELNQKLFYYFQYVEHVLKIKIIPGGPKVVL
ncbi:MAG: hypothetical protein GQ525_07335 [Draconibacterium sp.]|nr:hypothetical protein [Draconibacterium sp.]